MKVTETTIVSDNNIGFFIYAENVLFPSPPTLTVPIFQVIIPLLIVPTSPMVIFVRYLPVSALMDTPSAVTLPVFLQVISYLINHPSDTVPVGVTDIML